MRLNREAGEKEEEEDEEEELPTLQFAKEESVAALG